MAESVHYYMESMIPELEYYLDQGIFIREEIQEIVRQRSRLEFKLRRRISKKQDFQRFIEYELQLEGQRQARQKSTVSEHKPVNHFLSMSIMRHIHSLYQRMLKKFHGDLLLWHQYIDFSKQFSSKKILGKVFVRAIQYHPTCESLWILSAQWEHRDRHRPMFARTIYQRALRILPNSSELWIAYFRFELEFSIEQCKLKEPIDQIGSLSTSLHMGALPWAVFTHSVEISSDTISLVQHFIRAYDIEMDKHSYSFPELLGSMIEKYQQILDSQPNNSIESYFYLVSRYINGSIDNTIKAIQYISDEFTKNPSSAFMERILEWLPSLAGSDQECKELVDSKTEQLLNYAEDNFLMSAKLYQIWMEQLEHKMTADSYKRVLDNALKSFPNHGSLLVLATKNSNCNLSIIKQYLQRCEPRDHVFDIVKMWLSRRTQESVITEFFQLLDALPHDKCQHTQRAILYSLEWFLSRISSRDIPMVYEELVHKTPSFVDKDLIVNICLYFSRYYKPTKKEEQMAFMRRVYERGLLSVPNSDSLWNAYITMEKECGQHDRVGHLCWRRNKVTQSVCLSG